MPEPQARRLRVFLCHSSNDKPTLRELYRRLSSEEWIDPWLDEEKLDLGMQRDLEIEQAVEESDAILVCLSKGAIREEGSVQRQLGLILKHANSKPEGTLYIMPVRLEVCELPRRLRQWRYADYFPPENREGVYERLLMSLRQRANGLGILPEEERSRLQADQTRVDDYYGAPTGYAPSFLYQLPQPPADFTGRDELINLLVADFKQDKGPVLAGLTGMGGVGKTALGLVVAHKVAEHYPDAQIFLDLKGTTMPLTAVDAMRHVILSFEPERDLSAMDEKGTTDAYRSLLHGRRVLLFLDNARSAEQIAPLLPPETCALLVTSRWTFSLPGLRAHRLDVMSEESASAFLLELCPRIGDAEQAAAELAGACGCLPLALRIAGSFLRVNEDWGVEEYLAQVNDRKARLATLKESREDAELRTEPDLLATFELSYRALSEEEQERWRRLGVFSASFDRSAAKAMWDLEEKGARKLLGALLRYSLLDYDETSSRYSLHDLLGDYALSQMQGEEEQAARLKHASHYKDVLHMANDLYQKGGNQVLPGLSLFDLEWENIRNGQAWVSQNPEDADCLQLCNAYPADYRIVPFRLPPREYVAWLTKGWQAARQLGNKWYEARHLGNLGIAYFQLGRLRKAIEVYEQALGIHRETGNRLGEGITLGILGSFHAELGEVRKAIAIYEQALVIYREFDDRRGEASVLGNLGSAYAALGETRKAVESYEQVLAIMGELGDRQAEGAALGNLGRVYKNLGETRKAIEFYEQDLAIARQIGDRRGEGNLLGSLGSAYADLGEPHKAIELLQDTLLIMRELGDRLGEGGTLDSLGSAYADLGETRRATEFYEQYLAIARELGDRPGEGLGLANLALAYAALGETHKAIELHEQALAIHRETGERREEGRALGNLGNAYAALGETHKAIEFHEQALVIYRETGNRRGEGHTLGNLANAYYSLGDPRRSVEFDEQQLVIAREIGDRQGEGNASFNLGLALYDLGEKDRATGLMKQALEIYEEIESPYVEKARNALKEWGAL